MIDCGGIFSQQAASRLIEELRPLKMLFVEEPVNMDTPRGLVALRHAFAGVRIAAGERQMTRWGFREWLEQGAVDVIQADISHCGGIGELLRIAVCAEVYNVQVAPHNPYGPVALAANLHACAAMQNFLILEHCRHRPWFDEVQQYGVRVQDGCVLLSDRPGLGIELDWEYVEKHPYQQHAAEDIRGPIRRNAGSLKNSGARKDTVRKRSQRFSARRTFSFEAARPRRPGC
jgi:galactonate dehydratase